MKIYNFSSGPAVLPSPVLERARAEMLSLGGIGMSVMEISHRSKHFQDILESARHGLRRLLAIPANYHILFLQGGASLQFSMVPMNLLPPDLAAEYVITGTWGEKALAEAKKIGRAETIFSAAANGYRCVPGESEVACSPAAAYVHYTSNETIEGIEFSYDFDGGSTPVVCDASSNILSKPIDVEKYALIYAGAQKNIGPSGVTVAIIRDDLLERVPRSLPAMLNYRNFAENGSMPNTPNTWGIYIIGLVCEWLEAQGGLTAMETNNRKKAAKLYAAIDASDGYYIGHAERSSRSEMNVTFRLASAKLDDEFCLEAERAGLNGLRGHRTVGGIRASIYNAFPPEGVERLVEFMSDFASRHEVA